MDFAFITQEVSVPKWILFSLFFLIAGCSADVATKHMTAYQSNQYNAAPGTQLYQEFKLSGIIGGQETNIMTEQSNIPNGELAEAFNNTLAANNLLSYGFSNKYMVELDLADYRVSGPGFTMNVQTTMIYDIFRNGETRPFASKRIHSEGEAKVGDHFVGAARERVAAGRAITNNFGEFVEWLFTDFKEPDGE